MKQGVKEDLTLEDVDLDPLFEPEVDPLVAIINRAKIQALTKAKNDLFKQLYFGFNMDMRSIKIIINRLNQSINLYNRKIKGE